MKKKTVAYTLSLREARRLFEVISPELKSKLMDCWYQDLIAKDCVIVGSSAIDYIKNDELKHPDLKRLLAELFGIGFPDYKKGDLLFVRTNKNCDWILRYFNQYDSINDMVLCYAYQKTYGTLIPYKYHASCTCPLPK